MTRTFLGVALLMLVPGASSAQDKASSKDLKAFFERAEALELFSLNPAFEDKEPADPKQGFRGYVVLGKTTIKDAKIRKKIVESLYKGLEESDGTAAKCFIPRHGLRATVDGKTADIVICFQCLQMQFYLGAAAKTDLTTSNSPEKVLDEVLTTAGVPLAAKKK